MSLTVAATNSTTDTKGAAPGVYTGNFYNITGGSDPACIDGTCTDLLGTVAFDVTVQGPVTSPEPGSLPLLITGILVLATFARRFSWAK